MRNIFKVSMVLLVLALLAPVAPSYAAEGLGVDPQFRQEVFEIYKRVAQDPQYHALKGRLRGNLNNRAVVDQYLAFLPISPLEMLKAEMHAKKFEFGIPKIIFQYHQRWKQLHPDAAKKYYGATKASPTELEPAQDKAQTDGVSVNRNMAYNFPIPPTEYQGEIQIVVNPNNPNQLVAAANTWDDQNGTCGDLGMQAVFYSGDGGVTWGYTCAPDDNAFGLNCGSMGGQTFGSDPALSWNDNNEVFLNYMMLCYNGDYFYAMVVARSADGGATWNGQGVIKNSWSTGDLEDKNFYLIDTYPGSPYYGRHYTCWDRNNNEKFAYSTNNGVSWTEVDLPTAGGGIDLGCDIAVQKNGTVHVIWNTLSCRFNCSNEQTYYSRSTNGGQSWSTPVLVVDPNLVGFSNQNCPSAQDDRCIGPFGSIGIDNSGGACDGTIYVTYTDFPSGGNVNSSDVWVRRSTNGGSTWSAGVRVNDDGSGGNIQFHSFLAVDQANGNPVVAWHDSRHDPNNRAVDFYVARSTDCGQSFEANVKASQASLEFNNNTISSSNMSSQSNANYNPNQYGEYLGLDVLNNKAYVAWADTRGYFPSFTTDTQKDNVGFAVVEFVAPGPPPAAPAGLTVTGVGSSSVGLDWNDNTELDLAGYNVYRSTTSGSGYAKVNGSLVTSSAYTDNTVAGNTTYYYVVRAVNLVNAESANSNQVSATTPAPPAGLHVGSIVLSTRNVSGGNKYARATVTIVDAGGSPVSGATVTGTFSGNFTGTTSAVTNGSGVAVLEVGPKKGSTSFTFCVDNVTHSTLPYDSGANAETCDSI